MEIDINKLAGEVSRNALDLEDRKFRAANIKKNLDYMKAEGLIQDFKVERDFEAETMDLKLFITPAVSAKEINITFELVADEPE